MTKHDPLTPLRYLDLAVLVLSAAVFGGAGLPWLGWVVGAGVWVLWRGIGLWADRRAAAAEDARSVVGIEAGSMIGRGWLLGGALLGSGLAAGSDVGLAAAVLDIVLFTIFFSTKMVLRPFDAPPQPRRARRRLS